MRETVRSGYLRVGNVGAVSQSCLEEVLEGAVVRSGDTGCATFTACRVGGREEVLGALTASLETPHPSASCVTSLDLSRVFLTDASLSTLADTVMSQQDSFLAQIAPHVINIDLSSNLLTDNAADAVVRFCSHFKLARLSLAHNYFTPTAIDVVYERESTQSEEEEEEHNQIRNSDGHAVAHICRSFEAFGLVDLDFGAEFLLDPHYTALAEALEERALAANETANDAMLKELIQSMESHAKQQNDHQRQKDELSTKEAKERKDVEMYEAERVREMVRRKNKFLQNERLRLKSKEEIRRQRNKEEGAELEEDETSRRAGVKREEEVERKQLAFAENNSKERLSTTLQFRKRQIQLLDLQKEFADKVRTTEAKHRADLVRQFVKAMGQCMVRERRRVFTKETEFRERLVKRQEEERKTIVRARRAGKPGQRNVKRKGEDIPVAETAQRSHIVAEEERQWKELSSGERKHRKEAKENTYKADLAPFGLIRVALRKEAFIRLDIEDQQEALREQCNIDFLLAAPDTKNNEGTEEMIVKLKEQQGEAFNARARERSVLLVEDWSVLNFEALEDAAVSDLPSLTSSFARSSFTAIPGRPVP